MDKEYWKMKKREQRAAKKSGVTTALVLEKTEPVSDDATLGTGVEPTEAQEMRPTDREKDGERPGWYIFGKEVRETNCWKCGQKYTTKLELSKFCTSKCKTAYLDAASHLRT